MNHSSRPRLGSLKGDSGGRGINIHRGCLKDPNEGCGF